MYLNPDAAEATLRVVASCTSGSDIALSYNQDVRFVDDIGREVLAAILPRVAESERCSLAVVDHSTVDELFTQVLRWAPRWPLACTG